MYWYKLIMFFEGIPNLFLMVHDFLLLIFEQHPFIDAKDKSRGVVLFILVEFWEGLFRWQGFPLIFRAKLNFNIIF